MSKNNIAENFISIIFGLEFFLILLIIFKKLIN
jgi:hypothetical protein